MSLKSQEAEEGNNVTLCCELSKKGGTVQWKREAQLLSEEIFRGKYETRQEGRTAQLTIMNLQPEDAGKYSCITGDEKTTAEVRVKGELMLDWTIEDAVPIKNVSQFRTFWGDLELVRASLPLCHGLGKTNEETGKSILCTDISLAADLCSSFNVKITKF